MRFALNYSPEALRLCNANKIHVDMFKLPDWEDLIAEVSATAPVYVHFSLTAGSPPEKPINWNFIERVLRETETTFVNVHLGVWKGVMADVDLLDQSPAVVDAITERILADLRLFVARFGADRVIGENLFCLDNKGIVMQASTLPQVIGTVINETGCGLLLDTAHAKMAAFTQGIPATDYISALPVGQLREVHVTGIGYRDDGRLGDHLPMRADDWQIYEWVMAQVHHNEGWGVPDLVACEYGGIGDMFRPYSEERIIADQIPRMVQAIYP